MDGHSALVPRATGRRGQVTALTSTQRRTLEVQIPGQKGQTDPHEVPYVKDQAAAAWPQNTDHLLLQPQAHNSQQGIHTCMLWRYFCLRCSVLVFTIGYDSAKGAIGTGKKLF